MAKYATKLVTCMGGVWRLTPNRYRKYLEAVVAGEQPNLDNYGMYLGNIDGEPLTDVGPEEAKARLEALGK